MKLYRLYSEVYVQKRITEVFPFFSDAGNLQELTPPWVNFRIETPGPIEMKTGQNIDYKLRVHGIPLNWRSEITVWEPPLRFVDEQVRGPYKVWHHEHRFEERGNATVCIDEVHYAVPGGALINKLFVEPDVRKIFEYRRQRLLEIFRS